MTDKNYCMSSYLAFRYIENDAKDFYENTHHQNILPIPDAQKQIVTTAKEIDQAIEAQFSNIKTKKLGLLLSGGMDSAILASYMQGCDAYTFRFFNGDFQSDELHRAEFFAQHNNMKLHYVNINWETTVEANLEALLYTKGAPVHSIEPQIYQAAMQAMQDNVTLMVIGESSDLIFGGMDQLLSRDWTVSDFQRRYIFTQPAEVLSSPVDMGYLFERYRREDDKIDFLQFMDHVFSIESSSSYFNAFQTAKMPYFDPYAVLKMGEPLDLERVRNGESKYLIRELFKMKYPGVQVPEKVPMPRPVDAYFANWNGPTRHEFLQELNMNKFTGNQRWQIYCLEKFLNLYEPEGYGESVADTSRVKSD